ncbi:cyclin-I [Chanos chanos]|uniref:Cyclin-I n=1 Tax=Chanos chanos TaxID=29144 RepID=A0A6J2WZM3_CHACN|nr:cyclin-I-like [Chanos chanos]
MKFFGSEENQRLENLLEGTLARETRLWRSPVLKNGRIQGTDIIPSQYQEVILWLRELCVMFQFCSDTFAMGVCVLNRLLAAVKAQSKYLKCIAITSLILAAKINEEDEVIAPVKDLLAQSGCNFSTGEILRMEKIILDKLHWDLYTATPIDFIHIFHSLLVSGHPRLPFVLSQKKPGFQLELWTRQVQHCMGFHQFWQFKGSTLALAIITLELERCTPDWFSLFTNLLKKAQIESTEFIRCKETVDEYLTSLELSVPTNAVYILDTTNLCFRGYGMEEEKRKCVRQPWSLAGRGGGKRSRGEGDVDEFYDGFEHLYNEGVGTEAVHSGPIDLCLSGQEKVLSCPPLQPPTA